MIGTNEDIESRRILSGDNDISKETNVPLLGTMYPEEIIRFRKKLAQKAIAIPSYKELRELGFGKKQAKLITLLSFNKKRNNLILRERIQTKNLSGLKRDTNTKLRRTHLQFRVVSNQKDPAGLLLKTTK